MHRIEEGIERRLVAPVLVLELGAVELGFPDVVIGLARGRELRAVELRLHPRDARAARLEPLQLGRVADVVEPVLAFLHAQARCELRPQLQVLRELGVEESGEARILAVRGGGRRRLRNGNGLRRRSHHGCNGKPVQMTHKRSLSTHRRIVADGGRVKGMDA